MKIFVTLFSGTVRPRRLKLGTRVDSGQMQRVYRNQAAAYLSLNFFIFLSNFQTLKFFVILFSGIVRLRWLKLGTHVDSGQMHRVYRNKATAAYSSFYFSFLSLRFSNIKSFRHTFLRKCEAQKVETCYTRGQWVDVSCIPESSCCCLLILLFFKLATHVNRLSFSPIFKH